MADDKQSTVSFKLDNDFKDVVAKKLDSIAPMTKKDWFTKAFALMEAQELKEQSPEFTADLNELETHTTRIYELVSNMIKQSTHLKESAVHTLEQQVEQQREIVSDYQLRVKEANEERDNAFEELETSRLEQEQLIEQLEKLKESLETNKLLINEYKEKNDVLNGLVAKNEKFAIDNEELKRDLEKERSSQQLKINELTNQKNEQEVKAKELEQLILARDVAHETALERLKERLEVEQERILLKAEREHQKSLSEANNEYTNKIQSLYDNMDKQREIFEGKINELQRQLDDERKVNKKK